MHQATFVKFIGDDGASVTGPAGPTGFLYFFSGTSSTSSAYISVTSPATGSIAIVQNTSGVQEGYRWSGSSWVSQDIVNSDIIFANAIGTEQLEISNSAGTSRIFMDGANSRIQIFDSNASNPRVVLGKLT